MIDMSQNRVPYGLLTDEEKAALNEHEKAGGVVSIHLDQQWVVASKAREPWAVYRTVPLPLTQDEIAWDRLPDWVEWVATDKDGTSHGYSHEAEILWEAEYWNWMDGDIRRIDDFPGIIIKRGTCDWKDSKQRRPK